MPGPPRAGGPAPATGATSPSRGGSPARPPSPARRGPARSAARGPPGRARAARCSRSASSRRRSRTRTTASGDGAASPEDRSCAARRSVQPARRPGGAPARPRLVGDDGQQPRPHGLARPEARQRAPGLDERRPAAASSASAAETPGQQACGAEQEGLVRAHEVGVGDGVAAARAPQEAAGSSSRGRLTTTLPTPAGAAGFREPPRDWAAYRRHDPPARVPSSRSWRSSRSARRSRRPPPPRRSAACACAGSTAAATARAAAPGEQAFETGRARRRCAGPAAPSTSCGSTCACPAQGLTSGWRFAFAPAAAAVRYEARAGHLPLGPASRPPRPRPCAASSAASGPTRRRASPATPRTAGRSRGRRAAGRGGRAADPRRDGRRRRRRRPARRCSCVAGAAAALARRRRAGPPPAPAARASAPRSAARRDLLHGPAVAVGVAEEEEAAPREVLDVAGLGAAGAELGPRRLDVVDDELQAVREPGSVSTTPGPDGDGARRPGRRELHEANVLGRPGGRGRR